MFQFNSKKLITLCRKLIGMIEDNQVAEELTDKIAGIEAKIETEWEIRNRYSLLMRSVINEFNSCHSESEKVTVVSRVEYADSKMYFKMGNRYNAISRAQNYNPIQQAGVSSEEFYVWAHGEMMKHGMENLFSKGIHFKTTKKYHGEETHHVTHS